MIMKFKRDTLGFNTQFEIKDGREKGGEIQTKSWRLKQED
jgi:hypothetical protein